MLLLLIWKQTWSRRVIMLETKSSVSSGESHHRHHDEYRGQHLTNWQPDASGAAALWSYAVTPRDKELALDAPVERRRAACPQVQAVSSAAAEAADGKRHADVVEAAALTPGGLLVLR